MANVGYLEEGKHWFQTGVDTARLVLVTAYSFDQQSVYMRRKAQTLNRGQYRARLPISLQEKDYLW